MLHLDVITEAYGQVIERALMSLAGSWVYFYPELTL